MGKLEIIPATNTYARDNAMPHADLNELNQKGGLVRQPCDLRDIEEAFGGPIHPELVARFGLNVDWDFVSPPRAENLYFVPRGNSVEPLTDATKSVVVNRTQPYSRYVSLTGLSINGVDQTSARMVSVSYGNSHQLSIFDRVVDPTFPIIGVNISINEAEYASLLTANLHIEPSQRSRVIQRIAQGISPDRSLFGNSAMRAELETRTHNPQPYEVVLSGMADQQRRIRLVIGERKEVIDFNGVTIKHTEDRSSVALGQRGTANFWETSFPAIAKGG